MTVAAYSHLRAVLSMCRAGTNILASGFLSLLDVATQQVLQAGEPAGSLSCTIHVCLLAGSEQSRRLHSTLHAISLYTVRVNSSVDAVKFMESWLAHSACAPQITLLP